MPSSASHPDTGLDVAADFSKIRYAQVWEDADVLVDGLDAGPGDTCLSIASAGDNALALLTRDVDRVVAIDVSAAQLACLALRVAAYRTLSHGELLELMGSRPSDRRGELYARCQPCLDPPVQRFWDARRGLIEQGIGAAGKFERYFRLFRHYVLPLTQSNATVRRLLKGGGTVADRRRFYEEEWSNCRWRLLFQVFFSRFVMGRLGRDPEFFRHVEGRVADRIRERARHALVELDPAENPYLQWILTGRHLTARPRALREEHFDTIRERLDRLVWRQQSLEDALATADPNMYDAFNLSDVFEYVSESHYHRLLTRLAEVGRPGARLAYWNMMVPRTRPSLLAHRLEPLSDRAAALSNRDKAFFYERFVLEKVL